MPSLASRGAFVRSMATRGALGGLASATSDALDVLDAAGYSTILIETVGVGQAEVDVACEVETVVVVTVAGLGDDVQAAKAGLLEIGDVFVVNKADRPGAEVQVELLEAMLALRPDRSWRPPVIPTVATTGAGVAELVEALLAHRQHLAIEERRRQLRHQRALRRVQRVIAALLWERLLSEMPDGVTETVDAVAAGRLDPYSAAARLLSRAVPGQESGPG